MLLGDASQGSKFTKASVGENDVDSLPLRLDGLVEPIKVGKVGNISLDAGDIASDRLNGLVKLLLATPRDEDECPLFDEEFRRCKSYSRGAAGDDRHFSLQLAHWTFSFSRQREGLAAKPRTGTPPRRASRVQLSARHSGCR